MPSHSLREKEFALQNDGFITKLLKPELPCTPTRQSSPVRTRFEPKAHRVSTGGPPELEAPSHMKPWTMLVAGNGLNATRFWPCYQSTLQLTPLMFRIGPSLVTGLLYLVGVQGNSGLRSLVMKPSFHKANSFSKWLWVSEGLDKTHFNLLIWTWEYSLLLICHFIRKLERVLYTVYTKGIDSY